jgi:hypothetical protein
MPVEKSGEITSDQENELKFTAFIVCPHCHARIANNSDLEIEIEQNGKTIKDTTNVTVVKEKLLH